MFNFFKNWFVKEEETLAAQAQRLMASAAPPPAPSATLSQPAPVQTPAGPATDSVRVLLKSAVALLPSDLQTRVSQTADVSIDISIPIETVVSQIGTGAVKISFGELRRISPLGTFNRQSDRDTALVALPLAEILPQLNPALLNRRNVQREVDVPDEITGPFGNHGQGLSLAEVKSAPTAGSSSPGSVHFSRTRTPAIAANEFETFSRVTQTSPVASAPASASQPETISMSPAFRGFSSHPRGGAQSGAMSVGASVANSNSNGGGNAIQISIAELAATWPDSVRTEIVQLNLSAAKVALPETLIEQGLKKGKVAFPWRELRGWIRPPCKSEISVNDSVVLEVPLKIIAPLFLAKDKATRVAKPTVDEQLAAIPSLFFGSTPPTPQPAPASPAPKLEDTNYYVWKENEDRLDERQPVLKPGNVPGTSFLRRYATPNEIISKAAALDGVAGALIALPDGLLVASHIPPEMNPDMIAAFLPQIFGRLNQCAKELRMGEMNNLKFTVGNVPWKIFRVGAIYFAAFGRGGQSLPTAQLAGLAAELDRKPK